MSNGQLTSRDLPPLYVIDLSLPAHIRYVQIATDYKVQLAGIATLYDEASEFLSASWVIRALLKSGRKLFLRRLYTKEETEEAISIARSAGIEVYHVVAFNTMLDLYSGCMSAGVMIRGEEGEEERMMHLRVSDMGDFDPLRELVVRVEYVREGKVIARGVTIAGYIGVLTGVREGLSMSLNFRANLISTSPPLRHRMHQLLLFLGFRRSVGSYLRRILLYPGPPPTLADLKQWATDPKTLLPSCYLIFCSPTSVLIVERDLATAACRSSEDFLVCTNHDLNMEELSEEELAQLLHKQGVNEDAIEDVRHADSVLRKKYMMRKSGNPTWRQERSLSQIKEWLEEKPVKNENTHFSCIMDPSAEAGGLVWVQRFRL